MNWYLDEMSRHFSADFICLGVDGAGWHRSKGLIVPKNIGLITLPAYTPEMNPMEQIWDELCKLTPKTIKSITCRSWIVEMFAWK